MFEYLDWESHFFNYKIGRLFLRAEPDLSGLLRKFKTSDFDLMIIHDLQSSERIRKDFQLHKIELLDQKLVFEKSLSNANSMDNDIIQVGKEDGRLEEIAIQSGLHSRFKKDSRLNPSFEKMYRLWLNKSIKATFDDVVFTTFENDKPKGIITLKQRNNTAQIGLFAVDSNFRQQGIGEKFIKHAEFWANQKGASHLRVATQKDNNPACKFYEKQGFHICESENIYHLWK